MVSQTIDRPGVAARDPLVRYGHLALAVAFVTAYPSAEEESRGPDQLHVWSGYAVGTIVAVRIVWGGIGTGHARFSDLAYGPMSALRYFADRVRGHARRHIGHGPIGTAMVVALLFFLSGTDWQALAAYGDTEKGPLATWAEPLLAPAQSERNEGRSDWRERRGSDSVMLRKNLVAAMLTGTRYPGDEATGARQTERSHRHQHDRAANSRG